MKVTLLAVVTFAAVAALAGAADPECVYRKLRGLAPHWPNPSNCASYYRCSTKNIVRSIKCPVGKEYNPKTGKCSTTGRGLCKLSLAAPLAEATNACANEVNGAFMANAGFCNEYYICDEQLAYPQICNAGSMFDIKTNRCIPDTDSECWQNYCLRKPTGQLIPSQSSCLTYYECQNDQTVMQNCASGTYFDTRLASCVVDENNSNCWENFCIGKPDGSAMGDSNNCTIFYMCLNQKATLQVCPKGSYFDKAGPHCIPGTCPDEDCSTTTTTAPPTDCDCPDGSVNGDMVANKDNCRMYFTCINGELIPGDCLRGNYFDGILGICVEDSSGCCPESSAPDCVDGNLASNEDNCNQYYECEDGLWQSKSCPSGSFFNKDQETCVLDTANECPQCNIDYESGSSDTETPNTIAVLGGSCKEIEPAVAGENCWSYLACISGSWKQESCIGGYFFDASVGICRRDDSNHCPENKILVSASLRSRRAADSDCACPDGMTNGSMIAHPTECDKYQICQNGELIDGSCGQGNIFSSCDSVCVPDTDATCWVCSNKPNGYQMINPTDCTAYITCNNGVALPTSCPSGEWYNGDSCIIDVTGQCINPCSCGTGNVAHPICSKYYQCTDGVPQVVECAAGEGFDTTSGKCSTKVTCAANQCATAVDGTTIPVAGDDTRFYLCQNNVATIRSCPADYAFDANLLICLPQPSSSCDQSKCTTSNQNLVYPSQNCDNTTFCLCQNDGAYLKHCEAGLTFDEEQGICDFTGPCDPRVCGGKEEYSVSLNYEDANSFCLCRADQPTPVPCPIGYTFNAQVELCVLLPQPDPRCCRNYCVNKPNGETFPTLTTDAAFCLCMDEVPSFINCLDGKIYDAELGICMTPEEDTNCICNECDSTQCADGLQNQVFPANTDQGFCYCKEFCGVYTQCLDGKEFDKTLLICMEPAGPVVCDAAQCDVLAENQAYAANNGTAGFCYCKGGLPNYSLCLDDKVFDPQLLICMTPSNGCSSVYCDSEKCSCLAEFDTFPSTNEEDDTSFCMCRNGEALYENCLNGKYYNPVEGICQIREAPCSACGTGQCAELVDNSNFAALNTTTGFCLCVEGVAVYEQCPVGKEFDTTLNVCLPTASASASASASGLPLSCDATHCQNRAETEVKTFAASDSINGFCTCQADGSVSFQSCGDYHIYDKILSFCVVDACDPALCRTRTKFEAFAARNTTRGFCSCDSVPVYYHCSAGHVFDAVLGACVDEVTAVAAACDPLECLNRMQFEAFAAKNTTEGFCSCDGKDEIVAYHKCTDGKLFDQTLKMCMLNSHGIKKRSVEPEEKFACEMNSKRSVPANCSQYEICLDGNWRRRTCTENRYYNPEQQRCLEPRDDMVCSYARVSGLPVCNLNNESETIPTKVENGNSCLQYFRCAAGKWRLRSCPKRHYYLQHLGSCLPMPEFKGDDFCNWLNTTEQDKGTQLKCQHLTVRAHPSSCDRFLMCMESAWWIQPCPFGMYFNRTVNYCLPSDENQCNFLEMNANVTCIYGQKRALATSCSSYEQCNKSSQWVRKSCGEKQQFEPFLGCVANDGSCQGGGLRRSCQQGELKALPLPESNCTQFFYYCNADEWHLGSCLRGHSFSKRLNRCQSVERCQALLETIPSSSCVDQPDGKSVAHPYDCMRFYLCLQEQPALLQSCPNGSFFDGSSSYCRPNNGSCRQIDSVCAYHQGAGLIAHADNCRAYYNCSSVAQNSSQLLYCPDGQYFNNLSKQCRLDQGQCQQQKSLGHLSSSLCSGVAHGTRVPHQVYCNLYYACVHGLAIAAECANKMRFNSTLLRCTPEPALGAELELSMCLHGQLAAVQSENGNKSTAYTCANLSDGSFVANYQDCTKYYICAGGVALTQRCGAGAYFDAEQLLCTQDDGTCPYVVPTEQSTNEIKIVLSSELLSPDPAMCEGKHGQLIQDATNCNNFYICITNKLRIERCYEGFFFNSTLQQCQEFGLVVEKEVQPKDLAKMTEPTQQPSVDREHTLNLKKCGDAPIDFASLCEMVGESIISIAEPGDCRRYISCDEQEPVSQRCRNGESYDSLLGICRQNDGTCLMENGERVGVCNGRHGQLARDTNSCRGYFVCVHGQKIEAECAEGQYFNKATNLCELDALEQCSNNSNDLAKQKSDD